MLVPYVWEGNYSIARNSSAPLTLNDTLTALDVNESSHNVTQLMIPNDSDLSTFMVIFDSILVLLSIAIISSNILILVIYTSMKRETRHKTANLLLFNQAIVDLFNGCITNGITIFAKWDILATQVIYQFSLSLSFLTLVLVALERYLFIMKPLFHRKSVSYIRIICAIVLCWISSVVSIPVRLVHLTSDDVDFHNYIVYFIGPSNVIFFVLIVTVIYFYVATFTAVKRFIHRNFERKASCRDTLTQDAIKLKEHVKELKVIKLFISMFAAFIFSYLPLFITGLIHITISSTFTTLQRHIMAIDLIFYLSSGLFNPMVTLFYKEDYRQYLKALMRKVAWPNHSSNSSIITGIEKGEGRQVNVTVRVRKTNVIH